GRARSNPTANTPRPASRKSWAVTSRKNVLELTGEVQLLGDFDDVGTPNITAGIDDYQAIAFLLDNPGNDPQPVVRFGVRAVAGGDVTLRLDPADEPTTELLLRGIDEVISPLEVSFETLPLAIGGIRSTDTNASGAVTPLDALRVVNFLGRYGNQDTDGLPALIEGEGEDAHNQLASMRRLDTNADGRITPRDALAVINDIAKQNSRGNSSAEGEGFQFDFLSDEDDQDDEDYEPDSLSLI
ncbi:MAG: dockerin type I domain-containing protein, partial [Planctomycetota bacterium]